LSKALVVAQVALSLLLLIGAGLFIRTMYNLQRVNLGFNQDNLLLFALQPRQGGYKEERLVQFYRQLFERLDNLPGVRSATFGRVPLIAHYGYNTGILLPGETEKTGTEHITNRQMVRENYFSTMEIPLLRGRSFSPQDAAHAPKVAIVNETFGRKFFPNEEVVGKHVVDPEIKHEFEIVGVVADTKYDSQRREIQPLLYTPWLQEGEEIGEMYFSLRTAGEPTALVSAVRQAGTRSRQQSAGYRYQVTNDARAGKAWGRKRLYARLLSFFGGLALSARGHWALGRAGVFVAQRTNEIGIRMALGAQAASVLKLGDLAGNETGVARTGDRRVGRVWGGAASWRVNTSRSGRGSARWPSSFTA